MKPKQKTPGGAYPVRRALAHLQKLQEEQGSDEADRAAVEEGARDLTELVFAGLPAFFYRQGEPAKGTKSRPRTGEWRALRPVSSRIKIDGDTVSGQILSARARRRLDAPSASGPPIADNPDEASGQGRRGWRLFFSTSSWSPSDIEWAHATPVPSAPVQSGPDAYRVDLAGLPPTAVSWGNWLAALERLHERERRVRRFWGGQPADFHLHWAAAMADELLGMEGRLPPKKAERLRMELADGLRKRRIVIERNTGLESGNGFNLCLPSFEIEFVLMNGGNVRIESIAARERILLWESRRTIYPPMAGEGMGTGRAGLNRTRPAKG